MNPIACGEPQKACLKKATPRPLSPALCVMGGGPERAQDMPEATWHLGYRYDKGLELWAPPLALDILEDTGLSLPLDIQ